MNKLLLILLVFLVSCCQNPELEIGPNPFNKAFSIQQGPDLHQDFNFLDCECVKTQAQSYHYYHFKNNEVVSETDSFQNGPVPFNKNGHLDINTFHQEKWGNTTCFLIEAPAQTITNSWMVIATGMLRSTAWCLEQEADWNPDGYPSQSPEWQGLMGDCVGNSYNGN